MLRFYILHSFGGFALVELTKKEKITSYDPIKNLSPPLERKRVPWEKNEKRLHQITHNIVEAHPHSKI
jgi:hypothetical protein